MLSKFKCSKHLLTALIPTMAAASCPARAEPPVNDNCGAATVVTGTYFEEYVYPEDATIQSCEANPACYSGSLHASVWYEYTAPADGEVWLSTSAYWGLVLAAYDGCAQQTLSQCLQPSQLGCEQWGIGSWGTGMTHTSLHVSVQQGQTMKLQIAHKDTVNTQFHVWIRFFEPQPHDSCANAKPILANHYEETAEFQLAGFDVCEPLPTCGPSPVHSLWYSYVAPSEGRLSLSLCGFDAQIIALFDGCAIDMDGSCAQPNQLTCASAERSECAEIYNYNLTPGQHALIELVDCDGGWFQGFKMVFHPEITNDHCSAAHEIDAPWMVMDLDVYEAVNGVCPGVASCASSGPPLTHAVWFRYTAPMDGFALIKTQGSDYDTVLSVYDGCASQLPNGLCFGPTELACNDDFLDETSRVQMSMSGGQTYLIRVARRGPDPVLWLPENLHLEFSFSASVPPPNDMCSNATLITSDTFNPAQLPIGLANASANEPLENCESLNGGVSNSVFYKFVPAADGNASINTFGSSYDTVLSVFNGCGVQLLPPQGYVQPTLLACNNDVGGLLAVSAISNLPMEAGQTYIIKVAGDGPSSDAGALDFNFSFVPGTACAADIAPAPAGDGMVNVIDLLLVINTWGTSGAGDVDKNGVVNVTDLLAVINAWGACQ